MKKYYILAVTFLCLLMGQSGYAQDYQPRFEGDLVSQITAFLFSDTVANQLHEVVIMNNSKSSSSYVSSAGINYLNWLEHSTFDLTSINTTTQSEIEYYVSVNPPPPLVPTWYLDYDGDGYCSETYQSESSPGVYWKGWTYGYDCDDYDSTKTTDCNVLEKPCIKANLADLVYDSHDGIPNDYSKLPSNVTIVHPLSIPGVTFTNTDIGFNSTLYRVDNGNGDVEYIYATEGSTLELQDWLNNGQQGIGHIADQYTLSVDNAKKIKEWASTQGTPKISFTGHSLGGGLANANALATGYPATVFNPAGLHDNTISRLGLNLSYGDRVNYYVNTGEIVDIANTLLSTPARGTRHEIGNNAVVPAAVWYTSTLFGVVYSGYLHTMGSVLANLDCAD